MYFNSLYKDWFNFHFFHELLASLSNISQSNGSKTATDTPYTLDDHQLSGNESNLLFSLFQSFTTIWLFLILHLKGCPGDQIMQDGVCICLSNQLLVQGKCGCVEEQKLINGSCTGPEDQNDTCSCIGGQLPRNKGCNCTDNHTLIEVSCPGDQIMVNRY